MTDIDTRTVTLARLRSRAANLLPVLAEGAAHRERLREPPYGRVRRIVAEGLGAFRVPARFGGAQSSVSDAVRFVVDLASADANLAQALGSGFTFVEALLANGSGEDQERWLPRVLAGELFAGAGEVPVRTAPHGHGVTLTGEGPGEPGVLYADRIVLTAAAPDGTRLDVVLPRGRTGLVLVDDADALGQRLAGSGTVRLDGAVVLPEEIRRGSRCPRSPVVAAFGRLYDGAVLAGIAHNAMTDAVTFVRHGTPDTTDPYVHHAIGEISAHAYAAEAAVLRAAAALDQAWRADLRPNLVTAAGVEVAQAAHVAAGCALAAASLVFDAGGGPAAARQPNLDRHWRNARAVAARHPRERYAATVGAYRLHGTEPL